MEVSLVRVILVYSVLGVNYIQVNLCIQNKQDN